MPDGPASHPARNAIRRLVQDLLGLTETDIQRYTGMSRGAVRHHLRILTRQGVVQEFDRGKSTHYFPMGTESGQAEAVAALRRGRAKEVLRQVIMDPGIPQHELLERLAMTRKVLGEVMGGLVEAGLIESVREGRTVTYLPGGRAGDPLLHTPVGMPTSLADWAGLEASTSPLWPKR